MPQENQALYQQLSITHKILAVVAILIAIYIYYNKGVIFSNGGCSEEEHDLFVKPSLREICDNCLECLTEFGGVNLVDECKLPSYSLECAFQLNYLYGTSYKGLPCEKECKPCQEHLPKMPFAASNLKSDMSHWHRHYPNLFSAEDDSRNISSNTEKDGEVDASGLCCETSLADTIFISQFESWYPVWFHMPWENQNQNTYQHYQHATCRELSGCQECVPKTIKLKMLMTKTKPNPKYGHTFDLILLPFHAQFVEVPLPSYCQCLH